MAYDDKVKSASVPPGGSVDRGIGETTALVADLAQKAAGEIALTVAELPALVADLGLPDQIPVAILDGDKAKFLDLKAEFEKWREAPARRAGTAQATTLASFIALVERHKDKDSVLFARTRWPEPSLTAVFDYHQKAGSPRFGQHRAKYSFPVTPEFEAWIKLNGNPFGQAEFAAFVEDRIADLSVATDSEREQYETLFKTRFAVPTDLVDLARGLEVNVGSKVKNAVRLQTGEVSLTFETEHRDAAGGELHIPGLFMLRLPAFVDGALCSIVARLRYRLRDGAVLWFYELYQWEEVLRRRVATDFAAAATQTGLDAFEGSPEAS